MPRQWQKFAFRDLNIEGNALFLMKKVHALLQKGTFHLEKGALLGCWEFSGGKCPPAPRFRRPVIRPFKQIVDDVILYYIIGN